jgi:hypothetical protein
MGYFLLYEAMLDTVLFARDKWLVKDGIVLLSCKNRCSQIDVQLILPLLKTIITKSQNYHFGMMYTELICPVLNNQFYRNQ